MEAGVRQGCPLSSVLFNLTIEHVLRSVKENDALGLEVQGSNIKYLAYADDILIVAPSPNDLQTHLDSISLSASRAGLRLKPRKCTFLAICNARGHRCTLNLSFNVQGSPIPLLQNDEAYKYLGIKVGFNQSHDYDTLISESCLAIRRIHDSLLAPWQMLLAIRLG